MTAQAVEELPLVSGRHRDKALASARKLKAIQLKTAGLTYQQIADQLGYASRGTVYKIIKDAQSARLDNAVEEHRAYEVDRLNAMQGALWDRALAGDLQAIDRVLRLIEARCRLWGLLESRPKEAASPWPCCQGPATLVVRGNDCRHDGCDIHGIFGG